MGVMRRCSGESRLCDRLFRGKSTSHQQRNTTSIALMGGFAGLLTSRVDALRGNSESSSSSSSKGSRRSRRLGTESLQVSIEALLAVRWGFGESIATTERCCAM